MAAEQIFYSFFKDQTQFFIRYTITWKKKFIIPFVILVSEAIVLEE